MKKFKDINHVPVSPKGWRDPANGHEIRWDSVRLPFHSFYAEVVAYCERNGRPLPSADTVEDIVCSQCARMWWTDDPNFHAPVRTQRAAAVPQRSGGCRGCGKRK